MRRLASFVLGALIAASLVRGDEKSEAAGMAEWKREIAQRQAKLAADFAPLMEGVAELEVFILDAASGWDNAEKRAEAPALRLDRWRIVRQAKVTDAREIALLRTGIRRSIETGGPVAACFNPRHGVRFTKNGRQVELILCFECAGMEAKGSSEFDGAPISGAAEADFYRVFRAHGLVRPAQLQGKSDAEMAKMLVGEWTSAGTRKEGKARWTWQYRRSYAADGSYSQEGETTFELDGDKRSEPFDARDEGRWRIEDGLLFVLSKMDRDDPSSMEPYEHANPLLEVAPNRIVLGSTSVEESDDSIVLSRK
jgi:hypothetical protein